MIASTEELKAVASIETTTREAPAEAAGLRRTGRAGGGRSRRCRVEREIDDEMADIMSGMTHALRSPLWAVQAFAEMLAEETEQKPDGECSQSLGQIALGVERLGGLVQAMGEFSRICRHELVPVPVDLSTLARSILDGLKRADGDRVVEGFVHPGALVIGDEELLGAVLMHLLSNAWQATRDRCPARIEFDVASARAPGETCPRRVFRVCDNGVGFPASDAARPFRPFDCLHERDLFTGPGMGLAIVRRIVHMHGGRVWAEGTEDRGATFLFTLHDAPAPEPVVAVPRVGACAPSLRRAS